MDASAVLASAEDRVIDEAVAALARQGIAGGQEIRLCEIAGSRVGSTGDDETAVNAAVLHAIRLHEACFANRAVRRIEPRQRIAGAIRACDCDQRILRRTAAAHVRLQVTGCALIRVEARSQAVSGSLLSTTAAHDFDEAEARHAILKEI